VIITLVFKKHAIFFAENWEKIAENCDHNIDPWSNNITRPRSDMKITVCMYVLLLV
jgi:hypothetical protein